MIHIIIFIGLFIFAYCFYLIFVISNKKAIEKMKTGRELSFLKKMYNLDYDKLDIKKLVKTIALTNSFILALTTPLVTFLNEWIKNTYIWLLVCLVMALLLLIPLILITYHLIGTHYKKIEKGEKKNVQSHNNRK